MSEHTCPWAGGSDRYLAYHDHEWGRPVADERKIFEKLCLEGFQSGLSWATILAKRNAFRRAFASFEPEVVAGFDEQDIVRLMADEDIVRNHAKIVATISNARALIEMHERHETLSVMLWSHEPLQQQAPTATSDVPSKTTESETLARDLRRAGFRYVGPITVYSMMQSLGVVNDHLERCECREEVELERASFDRPLSHPPGGLDAQ